MCTSTNGFAVLLRHRFVVPDGTVAMDSDAGQLLRTRKKYCSEFGVPKFVGTVRQNGLNTPKSRCDAMADLQGPSRLHPPPSSPVMGSDE